MDLLGGGTPGMFSWRGGWSRGSCHSPSKEVRCGGVRVGERDRGGRDGVI